MYFLLSCVFPGVYIIQLVYNFDNLSSFIYLLVTTLGTLVDTNQMRAGLHGCTYSSHNLLLFVYFHLVLSVRIPVAPC